MNSLAATDDDLHVDENLNVLRFLFRLSPGFLVVNNSIRDAEDIMTEGSSLVTRVRETWSLQSKQLGSWDFDVCGTAGKEQLRNRMVWFRGDIVVWRKISGHVKVRSSGNPSSCYARRSLNC